jgi:hypothetical protein
VVVAPSVTSQDEMFVETGLAGKRVSDILRRQTRGLNYPNSALVLYGICSVLPKMCGSGLRRP